MGELNHFNSHGEAWMVDVSDKKDTVREAIAAGIITMSPECFALIRTGTVKKGDVLGTARLAGIMGAKKTSELIPLCHNIPLSKAEIRFQLMEDKSSVEAVSYVKTSGKTGVEMEALTAVNVALLTIYDMCKAVDRSMVIGEIRLLQKSGGRNGLWKREEQETI